MRQFCLPGNGQQRPALDITGHSGHYRMTDSTARHTTDHRLDSWKEIAAFFGRDERTVRRWEKERGLPAHRVPGGARSAVFAYTNELADWLKGRSQELDGDDSASEIDERTIAEQKFDKKKPAAPTLTP